MTTTTIARLGAFTLLLAGCPLFTGCSATSFRSVAVERTVDAAAPAGAVSLDVETRNGAVEVRADPTAERVRVEARLRAGGTSQKSADERVAAMDVEVRLEADGVLHVAPVVPGEWRSNDGASFEIVVPALGTAAIDTSNGRITIEGATGPSSVATSNGSVVATRCRGGLGITTSNGTVTVRDSEGEVAAQTSNGAIRVSLQPGPARPFQLRTSNGSIEVDVPPDWSGVVAARTSNGSVRFDRDGRTQKHGRSATVEIGSGGERSTASSSNGSIEIRVRRASM